MWAYNINEVSLPPPSRREGLNFTSILEKEKMIAGNLNQQNLQNYLTRNIDVGTLEKTYLNPCKGELESKHPHPPSIP